MEENRYIQVLFKKPNRNPKKVTIENSLEAMQRLVDGSIEVEQIDDILLVSNKDKNLKKVEPNVELKNNTIYGSFFIAGNDYENADFISLSKRLYRIFSNKFAKQKQNIRQEMECEEME